MAQHGVDVWTSSLRAFRVSRSPLPVPDEESKTTGGFGLPLPESSVMWDRDSSSWRTCPDWFGMGSPTSSPTLPTSGSMRNGVCIPRKMLVPLTIASGSGLSQWPTPTGSVSSQGAPNKKATNSTLFDRVFRDFGHSPLDPTTAPTVLGCPFTEQGIRLGLESTFRRLALQSPVGAERIALVDTANALRPRTVL